MSVHATVFESVDQRTQESLIVGKVFRRLIPFMCFLYFLNYLDRVNIQFAKLQMNQSLRMNDAQYGFAAGIFFVGYCLFEIPSNLILGKVGARRWIARIMVSWGLVSAAMCLMTGAKSFYALRLLLGFAEAGFFPGMVIYLSAWVPAHARARALAWFLTSTALAGVIGSPIAALLLNVHLFGIDAWRWLFLLEGIPTLIFGVVTWFVLIDRPEDARWLSQQEKRVLARRLAADHEVHDHHLKQLLPALASPLVWLMCLYYGLTIFGYYAINYWTSSVIKEVVVGGSDTRVSLLSAIPFLAAAVGMVIAGIVADRCGRRRLVIAVCTAMGCGGMLFVTRTDSLAIRLICLSVAAAGIWGTLGPFWSMPHAFLRGPAAAGGVALINSVGNLLGGFVGPTLIGRMKESSKDFRSGFLLTSMVLLGALLLIPFLHCGKADAKLPRG